MMEYILRTERNLESVFFLHCRYVHYFAWTEIDERVVNDG